MTLDTDKYLEKKMLEMENQEIRRKKKKNGDEVVIKSPTKIKLEEEDDPAFFLAEFMTKAE